MEEEGVVIRVRRVVIRVRREGGDKGDEMRW